MQKKHLIALFIHLFFKTLQQTLYLTVRYVKLSLLVQDKDVYYLFFPTFDKGRFFKKEMETF